jgi:hypothetical protein
MNRELSGFRRGDMAGSGLAAGRHPHSTSGATGLLSSEDRFGVSACDLMSAAFCTSTAASSGFEVAFANLSSDAA